MKNMDIKNAFQAVLNRKRKSGSTEGDYNHMKVLKTVSDSETKPIAKTVLAGDSSIDQTSQTDCTESKVLDSETEGVKNELVASEVNGSNHLDCQTVINKIINQITGESCACSDEEELNSSGDLNNTSILSDSSVLNSSALNERTPENKCAADPAASLTVTPNSQKSRRRMSPAQAKQRAELRAQKQKEKEARRSEFLAKQEEKRLEKMRREREKKQAQFNKQMKKELAEKEREKLRQEKKDQEEKEKMLKQKILEAKAEEKRRKEEEKLQREQVKLKMLEEKLKAIEEKRKQEEEKKRLELEKEKKNAKTKQAFVSFFLKSGTSSGSTSPPQVKESAFLPFQVSEDMVLAPIVPVVAKKRFDKEQLDCFLHKQEVGPLYLELLKSGEHNCVKYRKPKVEKKPITDDEVVVISDADDANLKLKAKLLQFHENIRPPYWGTWQKKSKNISPRRPFGMDEVFDYEVDSDEEWDEGGPGESLSGTEDEESEDDYEVDNEFFVPHGYLSAEEEGEEESATPVDPELQQARLKMKEREFMSKHNKKTTALQPSVMGVFFLCGPVENSVILSKSLQSFEAEILTNKEVMTAATIQKLQVNDAQSAADSPSADCNGQKLPNKLRRAVPEEAMPYLIRLLHANTHSRQNVIKEFQNFWYQYCMKPENIPLSSELKENKTPTLTDNSQPDVLSPSIAVTPNLPMSNAYISKRQLDLIITSMATWCKPSNPAVKKLCWWVKDEFLQKYGLANLPVPNEWVYTSSCKNTEDNSPDTPQSVSKMHIN